MPINAQSRWVSAIELSMSVAVSVRNYLQGKYWNMQLYAVHWCSSYICSLQCCMWGVIMTNPLQSAQSHPQHREANNIFTPRNMQQTLDKCFQFKWNKLIMSMYLKMFKYFFKNFMLMLDPLQLTTSSWSWSLNVDCNEFILRTSVLQVEQDNLVLDDKLFERKNFLVMPTSCSAVVMGWLECAENRFIWLIKFLCSDLSD